MKSIDLDQLVPESIEVTIGGKKLEVQPPSLRSLVTINRIAQKLQAGFKDDETAEDISESEAESLQNELQNEMNKMVPGLEEHKLNVRQLLALTKLVAEAAIPDTPDGGTGPNIPKATPETTTRSVSH